jgi:hypothetical protein
MISASNSCDIAEKIALRDTEMLLPATQRTVMLTVPRRVQLLVFPVNNTTLVVDEINLYELRQYGEHS